MTTVRIADLRPNPFRDIGSYPLNESKIEALIASFESTGVWPVLLGRKKGDQIEIAFGHHRWAAMKRISRRLEGAIEMTVRAYTNEQMLQMMAQENMQEWGHDVTIELETVRAIVNAYAGGEIKLPSMTPNTPGPQIRYAPGFIQGLRSARGAVPERPYSASQIADFVGWSQSKTRYRLMALESIEAGKLREVDLRGLNAKESIAVVTEISKELKATERIAASARDEKTAEKIREQGREAAKKIGSKVSAELKKKGVGYRKAAEVARQYQSTARRVAESKLAPELNDYARETCKLLAQMTHGSETLKRIERLSKHAADLDPKVRKQLVDNLDALSRTAKRWADGFRFVAAKEVKPVRRQLA